MSKLPTRILRFSTVSWPEVQNNRGADVDFHAVWAHVSNQEHQVCPRGASDWLRELVRKSVSVHQDRILGSAINWARFVGLWLLLKQATSDAHIRKSGVSSSFRSVPAPVRTVFHASICVGRLWTARSHQRSARIKTSNEGGYRSNFRSKSYRCPMRYVHTV